MKLRYSPPPFSPPFFPIRSSTRYFSSFIFSKMIPERVPINKPLTTYKTVIFQPKKPSIKTTRYSLIRGDVIRKENETPSGIPASKKPKNRGMEEQEQNGVTAPKREAAKLPTPPLFSI